MIVSDGNKINKSEVQNTMPMLAMLVLSYAFTTYHNITPWAIVAMVALQFVQFVWGWKFGRSYEQNLEKPEEKVVENV